MADDNLQPEPAFPPTGEGALLPHDQVLAAIAEPEEARRAVAALGRAGFADDAIALLSPEDVLRHEREEARSPIARLLAGLRDTVSEDGRHAQAYLSEARLGHWILGVHTSDADQVERAREVLAAHHGIAIKQFGRWTVADLPGEHSPR